MTASAGPTASAGAAEPLTPSPEAALVSGLPALLTGLAGPGAQVQLLRRLSGGASQETWAFNLVQGSQQWPLVLRRSPAGTSARGSSSAGLDAEADLLHLALAGGVPVPEVLARLPAEAGLGRGFIMPLLPGETLGRRIAARHRPALAQQCGAALARIHALPTAGLPPLRLAQPMAEVDHLRQWHARHGQPRPVFQLALAWLTANAPADTALALVHGDFRNGNLLVDLADDRLVAVLDWELASLGDPMADLAWLAVNSWRYGQAERPVGGFGHWAELLDGYRAAGGRVDETRLHWWQVLGTLRWGVICESMAHAWLTGAEPVLDKAAIGRRASETEIDLLDLLVPRAFATPAAGRGLAAPDAAPGAA